MKRKLIPILVILLAIGMAAWWFDLPARLGNGADRPGELTLYGNVDIRQVQLGFRVGGRIAEMAVDEGDAVDKGTRLASLDSRPYEDAVSEAEAQRASQAAQLAKLQAGPRKAEIAQARAQLAEREADLRNAQQALTRSQELRPRGAVSQASLDQTQAAKDMAVARVSSAREALQLLEEGSRPEDIAAAQANLQGAEARLAAARTALADTVLDAPSAGTVLSRVREPGAIVASGETVFVLSLDQPVWVRAYIPEPDLGRIHPGMTVDVATDTAGHHYIGRIGFISPVAEFTPKSVETTELRTELVYRLRIVVQNADAALRQGMPVTVHVSEAATAKPADQ